jgi:hypothetical protein
LMLYYQMAQSNKRNMHKSLELTVLFQLCRSRISKRLTSITRLNSGSMVTWSLIFLPRKMAAIDMILTPSIFGPVNKSCWLVSQTLKITSLSVSLWNWEDLTHLNSLRMVTNLKNTCTVFSKILRS